MHADAHVDDEEVAGSLGGDSRPALLVRNIPLS